MVALGAFLVFEGGEGTGKSTQSRRLHGRLIEQGIRTILTHEPGGTPLGEQLRRSVKQEPDLDIGTELFLILAARSRIVNQVIAPALARGEVVVCDRFALSTLAYQGWGRGLDLDLLRRLNDLATNGATPDLVVLLDMEVEAGLARKPGGGIDNFESESIEFHNRVREGYLTLASENPDRWLVVDATLPPDRVEETIWERVSALLKRKA
jgi:dTMP kinase